MQDQSTALPDPSTVGVLDQFQTDFIDAWRRLPNKLFFAVLLVGWLALFQFLGNSTLGYLKTSSLLSWMYQIYAGWSAGDDADRQGLWIPFVVLGLYWWKRKELLALPLKSWWPGLLIMALGLVLHIVGYSIQQGRVSVLALFIGLYGLTGLAWGRDWLKASYFPFFLFLFCVPFTPLVSKYTVPLQIVVCQVVEFVCHNLLAIEVIRSGTQLFDPQGRYQYEVVAACSGIRSVIAIGTMATIGAFLFYRAWWRRILLIGSTVPLAIAGNVLRLLLIVIAAEFGGQEAGNYVHEGGPGGIISLLPYVPAFVGLMALGRYFQEPPAAETKPA